jgi:hypothetical protein
LAKTKNGNRNIFRFLFLPKGKNTKAENEVIIIPLVTTNGTSFSELLLLIKRVHILCPLKKTKTMNTSYSFFGFF